MLWFSFYFFALKFRSVWAVQPFSLNWALDICMQLSVEDSERSLSEQVFSLVMLKSWTLRLPSKSVCQLMSVTKSEPMNPPFLLLLPRSHQSPHHITLPFKHYSNTSDFFCRHCTRHSCTRWILLLSPSFYRWTNRTTEIK